jgi:hypothetical protein
MANVGGSGVAVPVVPDLDDHSVRDDELVWHLIDPQYYRDDPLNSGKKVIDSGTVSHGKSGISFLRPDSSVITVSNIQKNFPGFGIAQLKVEDIRKKAGCLFAIENDPLFSWPKDSHVCAYKAPKKSRLKGWQKDELIRLLESNLILLPT